MASIRNFIDIVSEAISESKSVLTEQQVLTEAQNYSDMFSKLHRLVVSSYTGDGDAEKYYQDMIGKDIDDHIRWAKTKLKRNDRIIWYLRLARIGMAGSTSDQAEVAKYINQEIEVYAKNAQSSSTSSSSEIKTQVMRYSMNNRLLRNTLEHFMGMPIAAIQNEVFSWQSPTDLMDKFLAIEGAWKAERSELVPHDEDDRPYLTFDDGFAWVLLDRAACDLEGEAMGHCGNRGAPSNGDRILSLRKKVVLSKTEVYWRPSLTFILHKDGYLGEMKGRGNEKPASKYHPYIIALLESDIIAGIRGGGYMPENNFSMSDLTPEEADALMDKKPSLATPLHYWKTLGVDDTLIKMIRDRGFGRSVNHYSPSFVDFSKDGKTAYLAEFDDVKDFLERYGDKNAAKYVDDYFVEVNTESSETHRKDMWNNLPSDVQEAIGLYLEANEPDAIDAWCQYEGYEREDFDSSDSDDVFGVIEHSEGDWQAALDSAVYTGQEVGVQNEMFETVRESLSDAWDLVGGMTGRLVFEGGRTGLVYDTKCYLTTDAESFLRYASTEEDDFDGYMEEEIKIEAPYYGWDGFDEEAALERFNEESPDFSEFLNKIRAAKQKMAA